MPADPERLKFLSGRQMFGSAGWATAQSIALLGSNAITGVVVARTLSVADFGIFSYAVSLASVGMAVVTGGLSGLAIKALIDDREHEANTLSALVVIREVYAILAYMLIMLVALTSGSDEALAATAVALLVFFARAWDVSNFWYQAHLRTRRSAAVITMVVAAMVGIRIGAALAGAGLWIFILLFVAESVIVSIALVVRYLRERDGPGFARPRLERASGLASRSWLLLLSAVASQINLRGDVIIIQAVLGASSVGIYATAARLSEFAYFLPGVFMTAAFPLLLEIRKQSGEESEEYESMLQRFYDIAFWVGVLTAAVLFVIGPSAITLLFGERYALAGEVLRIHVLALPFVFMAAIYSKWIIAQDLLRASLVRHVFGAAMNVTLALILVPAMGIKGAAIATVASYVGASYLACFFGRSTWPAGVQMSMALAAPVRLTWRAVGRRT